jgi:hypothetical protein
MRVLSVLLLAVLIVGCGAGRGSANLNAHPILASTAVSSISTLTPNAAPVNAAPFTMTVNGTNFGTDAVVFWNDVPQHTTFVSKNQLVMTVTDVDLSSAGMARVFVQSAGLKSNTVTFNVSPQ